MHVGAMIVKDEADYCLRPALKSLRAMLERVWVFDDHSTDDSTVVAASMGARVAYAMPGHPSFMEHEGGFRDYCYRRLLNDNLRDGDWVIWPDADEMFVSFYRDMKGSYHWGGLPSSMFLVARQQASRVGALSITVPRWEVWRVEEDVLCVRRDGLWGGQTSQRIFQVKRDAGGIEHKAIGCGTVPMYAKRAVTMDVSQGWMTANAHHQLVLLHLGYATQQQRQKRYDRYTSMANHGHNPRHIQSIMEHPKLERIPIGEMEHLGLDHLIGQ